MRTRVAHPIDPNPIIHENIELSHRREKGAQVIKRVSERLPSSLNGFTYRAFFKR
jgi:hypothetical protein